MRADARDRPADDRIDQNDDGEERPVIPDHDGAKRDQRQKIAHPCQRARQRFAQDRNAVRQAADRLALPQRAELRVVDGDEFRCHLVLKIAQGKQRRRRRQTRLNILRRRVDEPQADDDDRPPKADISGQAADRRGRAGKAGVDPFDPGRNRRGGRRVCRHGEERQSELAAIAAEIAAPEALGERRRGCGRNFLRGLRRGTGLGFLFPVILRPCAARGKPRAGQAFGQAFDREEVLLT